MPILLSLPTARVQDIERPLRFSSNLEHVVASVLSVGDIIIVNLDDERIRCVISAIKDNFVSFDEIIG